MLDFLTPSGGRELDLFTLSAQIAVPLAFALVVAVVPARRGELARWLALAGLACSLTLASCRLVDYHTLLDGYSDRSVRSLYHPAARLDSRSEQQSADASEAVPKPFRNDDLVVRRVWLGRLDLDFALGLDGLSLLLILTLNAAAFAAVLSSWQEPGPVSVPLALTLASVGAFTGALLSLDLVLFLAFGELGVACCLGLLASWGVLRPRALVLHGLAAASLAVAVLTLHGADVRDVVPAGEVAAGAAELRQLEPRTPPEVAEATASVHRLDPVALARFQRAATLIHTGQSDRLAVRDRAVELPKLGADPDRVADLAPGVDRAAALGRVAAQFAGTPRGQRLVFGLVAFAALARLLIAPWQLANLVGGAMAPPAAFLIPVLVGLTALGGSTLLRYGWALAPLAARDCASLMASIGTVAMLGGLLVSAAGGRLQAVACGQTLAAGGLVTLAVFAKGDERVAWANGVSGAAALLGANALAVAGLLALAASLTRRFGGADPASVGALAGLAPRLAALGALALLAGAAVPGSGVFLASLDCLNATLRSCPWRGGAAALAVFALVAHRLWLAANLSLTPGLDRRTPDDLDALELLSLAGLLATLAVMGLVPSLVSLWLDPAIAGQCGPVFDLRI